MCNAPGSFHDPSDNLLSQVKPYLESSYPRVRVVGNTAFALNDTMITPFKRNAANYNQDTKLFNIRHSGARMEMTGMHLRNLEAKVPYFEAASGEPLACYNNS